MPQYGSGVSLWHDHSLRVAETIRPCYGEDHTVVWSTVCCRVILEGRAGWQRRSTCARHPAFERTQRHTRVAGPYNGSAASYGFCWQLSYRRWLCEWHGRSCICIWCVYAHQHQMQYHLALFLVPQAGAAMFKCCLALYPVFQTVQHFANTPLSASALSSFVGSFPNGVHLYMTQWRSVVLRVVLFLLMQSIPPLFV